MTLERGAFSVEDEADSVFLKPFVLVTGNSVLNELFEAFIDLLCADDVGGGIKTLSTDCGYKSEVIELRLPRRLRPLASLFDKDVCSC